jgi:hypothetical protein
MEQMLSDMFHTNYQNVPMADPEGGPGVGPPPPFVFVKIG